MKLCKADKGKIRKHMHYFRYSENLVVSVWADIILNHDIQYECQYECNFFYNYRKNGEGWKKLKKF